MKTEDTLFRAEDIFRLQSVQDAQISPDGRQIMFARTAANIQTDRMESSLWMIASGGGVPRRLVPGVATNPRWAPDGSRVPYLADDSKGNAQIHVVIPETGRDATLTHLTHAPSEIAWSLDGRLLAFTSFVPEPEPTLGAPLEKPAGAAWAPSLRFYTAKHYLSDGSGYRSPGHQHLFVVASSGGEARQITSGSTDDSSAVWSVDGSGLIFVSEDRNRQILDFGMQRICQVAIATRKVVQLTPDSLDASEPAVSPDGGHIAFIGYDSSHPSDFPSIDAYVMDSNGKHARMLDPSLDRVAGNLQWASDSRAVLTCYADHGIYKVARLGLDGSFAVLANDVNGTYSVSRNGTLAFPIGGTDHPDELGIATDGQVHLLTHLNAPWLKSLTLGTLRPLGVRSSLDHAEVGAWTLLPPHYNPAQQYPTILEIHGGPYGEDTPYWRTSSQLFAASGYVVLYVNYRGSTSYGLKFSQAIDRNFPGSAHDDLMSAVDAAISEGISDPSRLYVTGQSAGGELVAWIVGKTARFRAAVALKPVIDQISNSLDSDQYLYDATALFAATPWDAPMTFWQHSALSLAAHVSTPTLLIVGEQDHRTPLDQSLEFYNALQIRGVASGLIIVPGASHESLASRPSQQAAELLATLAWFARYDKPGPAR